jgi:hypothetical protein
MEFCPSWDILAVPAVLQAMGLQAMVLLALDE